MAKPLPRDPADLDQQKLDEARAETDARLTPLFRRWPALSTREMADLRRLFDERVRLAKRVGSLRRRGLRLRRRTK
jgi:hypothetical protein